MVFNGARLGAACVVALGGKVHLRTELPEGAFVPIGFIAIGRPGRVYPPDQAPTVHEELNKVGFMKEVFGVETSGRTRREVMADAMRRYSRGLAAHAEDRVLPDA
jgi:carbonic anhydrase/acetyltransferase-like protein (isoleucine patch superfamily)